MLAQKLDDLLNSEDATSQEFAQASEEVSQLMLDIIESQIDRNLSSRKLLGSLKNG